MNQFATLALVSTAMLAGQAMAQSTNFAGFSVGASIESHGVNLNGNDGSSDTGKSTSLGLQGQYTWSISRDITLGAGMSASTGTQQAGNYANGSAASTSNRLSLDLMPGIAFSKDTLGYLKVSALSANATGNDGSNIPLQGVGYGVGVRSMLNKQLFWQAAYDSARYRDATQTNGSVVSLQGNVVSIGMGYKF